MKRRQGLRLILSLLARWIRHHKVSEQAFGALVIAEGDRPGGDWSK